MGHSNLDQTNLQGQLKPSVQTLRHSGEWRTRAPSLGGGWTFDEFFLLFIIVILSTKQCHKYVNKLKFAVSVQ